MVRLKAFTLVETIVSLIIISVVLSLSLMIFNQLTSNFISSNKVNLKVEEMVQKIQAGDFKTSETSFKVGGLQIDVNIEPYKLNANLEHYKILVFDNQKIIAERNVLICRDEN